MMEALKGRLAEIQQFDGKLLDAAIAIATDMRRKVRAGMRAGRRRKRDRRKALREGGMSAKDVRQLLGGKRKRSGVSIEAEATGRAVHLSASSQVQHLRREQAETGDLREIFRQHLAVAEKWRARRGL